MSRPLNSTNKTSQYQSSSFLSSPSSTAASSVTLPSVLDLETLNVKNIYLLDSLITKSTVSLTGTNRMMIQQGSFLNQISSNDSNNKILNFNNVYFEPDSNLANIVSIYTDNSLKIGKTDRPLLLSASNLTISSSSLNISGNIGLYNLIISNNLTYTNNTFNFGDPLSNIGNIIINFNSINNDGYFYYNPILNKFNLSAGLNILGDSNISGNLYITNIGLNNCNIANNLSVGGNIICQTILTVNDKSYLNDDTLLAAKLTVNGISTFNNQVDIHGSIHLGDFVSLNNTFVYFDAQQYGGVLTYSPTISKFFFNQSIYCQRNFEVILNLIVGGSTTINGIVTINNILNANRPVTISNTLVVTKDSLFSSNVIINGNATITNLINNTLNIGSIDNINDVTLNFINSNNTAYLSFMHDNNYFNFSHDIYCNGNSNITGNISTNSYLFVYYDANIYGNIYTNGIYLNNNYILSDINNNLIYNSNIILTFQQGNLDIPNNILINNNANILGNLYIAGNLFNYSNANIIGNLSVGNNLNLFNDANLQGECILYGNLKVLTDANVNGNLHTNSNLIVLRNSNIYGNLNVSGNLFIDKRSYFLSNIYISANANILGNTFIQSSLFINKNLNVTNKLTTDTILINTEFVLDNTILIIGNYLREFGSSNLEIQFNSSIYSGVFAFAPLHNTFLFQNLVTLFNGVVIRGDSYMYGNVYITGNSHVSGNSYVSDTVICSVLVQTSSIDKKKNIKLVDEMDLENLEKIKSYNYDLISNNSNNYGFLAHEVMENYPMLSNGDTVNYIGFIPLLLEKIKILENKIKILENKST